MASSLRCLTNARVCIEAKHNADSKSTYNMQLDPADMRARAVTCFALSIRYRHVMNCCVDSWPASPATSAQISRSSSRPRPHCIMNPKHSAPCAGIRQGVSTGYEVMTRVTRANSDLAAIVEHAAPVPSRHDRCPAARTGPDSAGPRPPTWAGRCPRLRRPLSAPPAWRAAEPVTPRDTIRTGEVRRSQVQDRL